MHWQNLTYLVLCEYYNPVVFMVDLVHLRLSPAVIITKRGGESGYAIARLTKKMSERESHYSSFLSCTPTIKELTEHVDVGSNWYIVGTMLDLDQRRLRSIEGQTGHTDTHKTIEMFNLWLTTTPTASRREILEVLRKRVVGENTVADEYEKHLKELHESTCMLILNVCP